MYGTSLTASRLASYDVSDPTAVKTDKVMAQTGVCARKNPNYVTAMQSAPYYVFSVTWPGPSACGAVYSVKGNGTLDKEVDAWSYATESGAHGLAISDHDSQLILYTADLNGDSVWAHAIDRATGKGKELSRLKMAKTGVHPRHVAVHPNGTYLYLVMEAENSIHQISMDVKTGIMAKDDKTFPLAPDGAQALLVDPSKTLATNKHFKAKQPAATQLRASASPLRDAIFGLSREERAAATPAARYPASCWRRTAPSSSECLSSLLPLVMLEAVP